MRKIFQLSEIKILFIFLFCWSCSSDEPDDNSMMQLELNSPQNLVVTQINETAFQITWDAVSSATSYQSQVSLTPSFDAFVAPYDNLEDSGNQINVINLESGTSYFFKVRSVRDDKYSEYSEVIEVTTENAAEPEPDTPLKEVATTFSVGMAVSTSKLGGQWDAIYKREYNNITAEWEMKMNIMYPSEGNYDFSKADLIVDYAVANNMDVHGHALIWHAATPSWVENFTGTDEEFSEMVEDYIKTTVSRYAGKVRSWDVVNEAFEDSGGVLRNSVFRQRMGDDYIEKCYQWTREADPNCLIFYNDYNMVINETKRMAALNMVDDFIDRGVPIDGFGFQMHISYNGPSKSLIASTSKEVTDRGLLLHFSELDVRANPNNDLSSLTVERSEQQKNKVKEVVEVYNAIPESSKFALTIWGLRDPDSWLIDFWGQNDWPLLYDANFNIKKAHTGFLEGLE